jgi:hypothetical protein
VTLDRIFELRLPDEINKKDDPVMDQQGIDCHDIQTIHALLRELNKLNDRVTLQTLFLHMNSEQWPANKYGEGTDDQQVPVLHLACTLTWLPSVLDNAVCSETSSVDNKDDDVVERLGHGRKDAARWLLTSLGTE